MLVLHLNWKERSLRLWAESLEAFAARAPRTGGGDDRPESHPFAAPAAELGAALVASGLLEAAHLDGHAAISLYLPSDGAGPAPSDRLAAAAEAMEQPAGLTAARYRVPALRVRGDVALEALLRLEDRGPQEGVAFGHEVPFWTAVARFVLELLADQRFVPTLLPEPGGLRAAWRPWLHDEPAADRVEALLAAMPPIARAADGRPATQPWPVLRESLEVLCDATVRRALVELEFAQATADRDALDDPQVAWLEGLLSLRDEVTPAPVHADRLLRDAGDWVARLEHTGRARPVRLCLSLEEPPAGPAAPAAPAGPAATGDGELWRLDLSLMLEDEPPLVVPAERVWSSPPAALIVDGHRIERPQELLLAELGRASRIYPPLEEALSEPQPSRLLLPSAEAARFAREHRPVLEESGFAVIVPPWWDNSTRRLGVRLRIESPEAGTVLDAARRDGGRDTAAAGSRLGLQSLVRYRWEIAVGEITLSPVELRELRARGAPLVRIGERWVELLPQDIEAAVALVEDGGGGEATLLEAIRLAGPAPERWAGADLPVLGVQATGWVGDLLGADFSSEESRLPLIDQPAAFAGRLRPYQLTGLRWLVFLESFGLGACLADDMGLGKTIQLIALLLHEREHEPASTVGPTLLVVPTSLVSNWTRELARFAPALRRLVHHGPQRPAGEAFEEAARGHDVVITTYALVPRDQATLGRVGWRRVVLDEAQYIKNPPTRQTTAIRTLAAGRRVALTGTPVENRLTELWSIMNFCNPGYLGPAEEFRRRCAVPIERHRDRRRADMLRALVRPFVLRRLKTDPKVIVDLPACVQTREYATLTPEQAALYQAVVDDLMATVDRSEGIQRRGQVLAALVRLKQVCNHPLHYLGAREDAPLPADAAEGDHRPLSARSGKCRRLVEMLEEVLAGGGQALVFTQFRRMGHLLCAMIRHDLDCEVLFLHGGVPPRRRQELVDRFQRSDGAAPVFVLSLRAGGVGLNLTAANHVFHFDRWWNPAVENQATDRAFRIGQTRTVQVHKFVCAGTLAERIDQMLEEKTDLASNIVGSGEQWVADMSSADLLDVLRLRSTALEADA